MLVDNDEGVFALVRALLSEIKDEHYKLDRVSSYETALERISVRRHDIYFFDDHLDSHTGLDLLKQAQANRNGAPVILLSGSGGDQTGIEAINLGAEDVLVKAELTPKLLRRALHHAIGRKGVQNELHRLATFPRESPNPVVEFSADGKVIYCNAAGQGLAATLNKDSLIQVLPSDVDQIVTRCLERGGGMASFQTTINDRTFSWSFVPIQSRQVVHLYGMEITERLSTEDQLRQSLKMEAVGQLAAGVAHDFNNILTVIQGHADLLLHKVNSDPHSANPLKQICLASERAGNLIRQLLMFSRKQVMQFRHVDLNQNLTNCFAMIERLMGEHIQMDFHPGPGLPSIKADQSMIEQIVMNLSVNARDAMPNGGKVTLTTAVVSVQRTATPMDPEQRHGEFVCLTFTDTGCGMDTQILSHIFEPFFTTKAVGKGTGLGLSTVFGIVRQHHGWLEVESRPDQGTTFRLFFPASDQPAEKQEAVCDKVLHRGRETVLVAEDEEALREMVAQILTVQGYKVLTAHSGRHALEVWERATQPIDLLVTDMVMPEGIMGGELAERLLAQNPKLKVVFTSGYSPGMAGKDLSLMEGRNFLPKPYSIGKLAQFVRQVLDQPAAKN